MPALSRLRHLPILLLLTTMPLLAEPGKETTQWLTVTLNHYAHDGVWPVRVADNRIWMAAADARKLGLTTGESEDEWLDLTRRRDLQATYDALNQQLILTAQQEALAATQHLISEMPHEAEPLSQATPLGGLTLAWSLYGSQASQQKQLGASTELRASGTLPGQFSSSMHSRYRDTRGESEMTHTRLMSSWQYDMPEKLTSLTLGDSVTTGSRWSRQVRFAGLHLARNFQLDPERNTAPRTRYSDSVVLPSTVDLYIDGLRQSSQQVSPGGYQLDTTPVFSGQGQAQVVITDINGQRRSVTLDLYGAPDMLAEGLSSASLDVGWMRRNYSLHSNDYEDHPLLDAGWRHGVSHSLSVDVHSEWQQSLRNVGAGADWLISPRLGIVSQHVALSDSQVGQGALWGVSYQWNGQGLGFSASTSRSSTDYADNARMGGSLPVSRSDTLWLSRSTAYGAFGAGWVHQQLDGSNQRYLNASWSKTFGSQLSATLSYTRILSSADSTLQLTLFIPFGKRDTLTATASGKTSRMDYRHQPDYQQGGWTWQMGQSWGSDNERSVEIGNLNRYGEWAAGVNRSRQQHSSWLSGEGSISLLEGRLFPMRYNQQGLALISTRGIGQVPVSVENRPAGVTDDDGFLLLTDLPRYHSSKITLDPLALPPEMMVPETTIAARPGTSEAVKVSFDLHRAVTVTARLVDAQHRPLPIGSAVSWPGGSTIVGREGFVWLEDPPLPGNIEVAIGERRCHVSLPASLSSTRQPRAQERVCQ